MTKSEQYDILVSQNTFFRLVIYMKDTKITVSGQSGAPASPAPDVPSPPGVTADALLCNALDIGEGILRCGGEIRRVEDTINRICYAFGAVHVEAFTITSLMIASVRMPDGSYSSQVRRILESSNDLHKLDMYNRISRRMCAHEITLDEAQALIREVKHSRPYPAWVTYIAAIFGAGGFAMFFGGNFADAAAAAVIGVIMMLLERHRPSYVNSMAQAIISSFAAGVLAVVAVKLGLGSNVDKVMIGTIMLLIPGMTIGTSIRDMLCGDIITGFFRLVQSLLLATIIALGYGAAMLLMGRLWP